MNAFDPSVAFTSEHVCDNLARKAVESSSEAARLNAEQFSSSLLMPIAEKLLSSGRMPRGALGKLCSSLARDLRHSPSVVDVEFDTMTRSKLSSNEEHRLAYVIGAATKNKDWVEFVCTEARLSRKKIEVSSTQTDFLIHRHALSRYMQRELKHADGLLLDMAEALHASAIVATSVIAANDVHIALPLKRGMLFGRVRTQAKPAHRFTFEISRDRPKSRQEVRESLLGSERIMVEIMTYVDERSLTPLRHRLHDEISEFMSRHRNGIKSLFDATYYTTKIVTRAESPSLYPNIADAIDAAGELVTGPIWREYSSNVGG